MYINYAKQSVSNKDGGLAVRLASMDTPKPNIDAEDSVVSDEILLIAVGNSQDIDAFNQLFERFAKKIFALGMKLMRNEQLANDLIQEALLNVWQKAPLYDLDKGSAKGWIFTLSRNRCLICCVSRNGNRTVLVPTIFGRSSLELNPLWFTKT